MSPDSLLESRYFSHGDSMQPSPAVLVICLNRASNRVNLEALAVRWGRDGGGSNAEEAADIGAILEAELEALAVGVSLASGQAVSDGVDVCRLAQRSLVGIAAGWGSAAGIADGELVAGSLAAGLLALLVAGASAASLVVGVLAGVGASWVACCGSDSWNGGAGLVENDQVLGALCRDLGGRDGKELAFDGVVDHAEDEGLALVVCIASGLAGRGSLDVGAGLNGGLRAAGRGNRAAGITSEDLANWGGRDDAEGSEGSGDGEGVHLD